MIHLLFNRLTQGLITLIALSFAVFALSRSIGDPLLFLLPPDAGQEDIARLVALYRFDEPVVVQYWFYLVDVLRGDLGVSVRRQVPVAQIIWERAGVSLLLISSSLAWSVACGLILGTVAAVWKGTLLDQTIRLIVACAQAAPAFWIAIILIHFLAVEWALLPASATEGWRGIILPSICLGLFVMAGMARLVRSKMLEALSQDYVLKARAIGLPGHVVVFRHAFRNVLLPVVTFIGDYLAIMVTSAVVVESVFAFPGLGSLALEAVFTRDYPLILGVTLVIAVFILTVNLVVDMCYGLLDPRVRAHS